MKRQVFFSFHFENDIWRVGQIRNIGVIEGQELFSDNGWEKVRQKKGADENQNIRYIGDSYAFSVNEVCFSEKFIRKPCRIL